MSSDSTRAAAEQLRLGAARQQAGQLAAALNHFRRATRLDASNPQAWYSLGLGELLSGNHQDAAECFRNCVERNPNAAEAYNNLGVALRRLGNHGDAIAAFRSAMAAREKYANAAFNLGLSLETTGALAEAEAAYRQATAWNGGDFNAANALGNLLLRTKRAEQALPFLKSARQLRPDSARSNGVLAMALLELNRPREALRYARTATAIEPADASWWATLGRIERLLHEVEPAIDALRRAAALNPQDWVSRCELGLALAEAGEVHEAREILASTQGGAHVAERLRWTMLLSLPSVYADEAEVDAERSRFVRGLEEIAANLRLETAQEREYAFTAVCGITLFNLDYQVRDNTASHLRFGDIVEKVMAAVAAERLPSPSAPARGRSDRIRIGVVSNHLMHHTVSRYFRKLLTGLDPARFELHVWYGGEAEDFSTAEIVRQAKTFNRSHEDPLRTAAEIRAAQLDALIYPEIGMDPYHSALGALRLAPVQCVLYGHPVTSGLASIDYFLGADALEPANAQEHYRETLVRLPGLGTIPERPPAPSDGSWLDAHSHGAPIALCLQNHLKLPPSFDTTLVRIVQRCGARLGFFVRNTGVGQRFRRRIENAFRAHGLDPEQHLTFLPARNHEEYLGAIARANLILDTPGFSGGATSLDAFSVGAPVLTWQGTMARGRQTAGMLALMGVDGLVATDEDDYVDKAVTLITDAALRAALHTRILERNGVLFEGAGVIAALENFLDAATQRASTS